MNDRLEIRHINNLKISLVYLVWLFPTSIIAIPIFIVYKQILHWPSIYFFRIFETSQAIGALVEGVFLFIIIQIMLDPLFARCRTKIINCHFINVWADLQWRIAIAFIFFVFLTVIIFFIFSCFFEDFRWILSLTEFGGMLTIGIPVLLFAIIVITLIIYWRKRGLKIIEIEIDKFKEWLENNLLRFPLKYAGIIFISSLVFSQLSYYAFVLFVSPNLQLNSIFSLSSTFLLFISQTSHFLGLFPLYYFLSKRIVNRFVEKHYEILTSADKNEVE